MNLVIFKKAFPSRHCYNCEHFISSTAPFCFLCKRQDVLDGKFKTDIDILNGLMEDTLRCPNYHNRELKCNKFRSLGLRTFFANLIGGNFVYDPYIFPIWRILGYLLPMLFITLSAISLVVLNFWVANQLHTENRFVMVINIMIFVPLLSFWFLGYIRLKDEINDLRTRTNQEHETNEITIRKELLDLYIEGCDWKFTTPITSIDELSTPEKLEITKKKLKEMFPDKHFNFEKISSMFIYPHDYPKKDDDE